MRYILPLAALALAGCSKAETPPVTVHEVMLNTVDKHADQLWDMTNAAIGDEGGIDPAKMDDKRWDEIARLAGEVEGGARQLAALEHPRAVKPGVKIADEDVPYGDSGASVQANLDKNPELFREYASTLAAHMHDMAQAARKHDAAAVGPMVDQLDQVCESCHLDYWYPSQKELVEKYARGPVTEPTKS
ncbi:MAG TPA: cytochrome c [Croceibacterium sp.]|nr:cytochrome c [Croceibacterium sp.]